MGHLHFIDNAVDQGHDFAERPDTPTAAQAADQPTSLSAPLGRPSLTLPAPYLSAHIFGTTNISPA